MNFWLIYIALVKLYFIIGLCYAVKKAVVEGEWEYQEFLAFQNSGDEAPYSKCEFLVALFVVTLFAWPIFLEKNNK